MATADLKSSLAAFVTFARGLKGDEKSEAQGFLERLFRALGHADVIEAGATFEFRVAKKPGSAQLERLKGEDAKKSLGKKFADLLWPERVLIEMKSRSEKHLERHYDQAFEYWQLIVPNRPRYVILCNFDEFWIYDFNQQLFDPVERVFLRDLADSANSFSFYGLDVLPFAAELAKVTLMLAKELEIREARAFGQSEDLFIEEKALPLENLDANILCADALFTPWPAADAIIGNPPYLGSRYLAKERGYDYANRLYARFPGVPKMAGFCTHWFRLAQDALPPGGGSQASRLTWKTGVSPVPSRKDRLEARLP